MSVYKRGNIWWYKFYFGGRLIRASAKTRLKTLAKEAEKQRRRELEEGYNNLETAQRSQRIRTFAELAGKYETDYAARNSKNAASYVKYCVRHLKAHLGERMLIEINEKVAAGARRQLDIKCAIGPSRRRPVLTRGRLKFLSATTKEVWHLLPLPWK